MVLDTSIPGFVYLNVTGFAGADLRLNSPLDTAWDTVATNWFNLNTSSPSPFLNGDTALLDDTAVIVTGLTIAPGVSVFPSLLTNSSTNNSFSISGAGRISGRDRHRKKWPEHMVLSTANNFTGLVDIQEGVLQTGNGAALGNYRRGHDGGEWGDLGFERAKPGTVK